MNVGCKLLLILMSFLTLPLKAEAKNISYQFGIDHNFIKVKCNIEGNSSGKTTFELPLIFNLDTEQPQNLKIYINGASKETHANNNKINLYHNPFDKITISYEIHKLKNHESNLYFNSSENYFFFFNPYFLIIPELSSNEVHEFIFAFPSYKHKITSNIESIGSNQFKLNSSVKQLKSTFFAGGNVIIDKSKMSNDDIIFVGDSLSINRDQIITFMRKIETIHKSFFSDYTNKKRYTIFLINSNNSNFEGEQKENLKIISLSDKSKFEYRLQRIIAHENLHQWFAVNRFGQGAEDQGENCWFIEGFNDYYTDYLNYLNGLLTLEEYIDIYNNCLQSYYTSPLQLITNKELGLNQYDNQIFEIAYLRGKILAHELNCKIGSLTNGRYNIDKYVKHLINLSKTEPNFKFSALNFIRILNNVTNSNFTDFLNQKLVNNDLTVEAHSILNGKAILTFKRIKKEVFDFDYLKSSLFWKITGVKKGSKSYIAGLRNGQKIIKIIEKPSLKEGVLFEIKEPIAKINKSILITPDTKEVTIPQYTVT